MDLVNDRKISDTPIFRAFVERVLKRRSSEILKEQNKAIENRSEVFWGRRSMQTSDISLTYSYLGVHRFMEMSRLRKRNQYEKNGPKFVRLNKVETYNRIIMGNYAGIMNELTYGLTDQMKKMMQDKIDKRQI